MKKKITIIGSTGSIGTQALEVLEKISARFISRFKYRFIKSTNRKISPKNSVHI